MNYASRRTRLGELMDDFSTLVLFSSNSSTGGHHFDVDRSFYYFTGLEQADMILQLTKVHGKVNETLFIQPFDPVQARWVGGRISAEEATKISGVKNVRDYRDFNAAIAGMHEMTRSYETFTLYLDYSKTNEAHNGTPTHRLARKIVNNYPTWNIKDSFRLTTSLRMIKDEEEVAEIRKANEITAQGVVAMMKAIGDGKREMEIDGTFALEIRKQGCAEHAFPTIAASGMNATILHYGENKDLCHDGELFLTDLGATSNHYCADVSRTFPVNGVFTERQKQLYQTVLDVQKLVEANAKPGLSTNDLNQIVIDYYEKVLPELGLTKGVREYYFHGVSHLLGLDCHDCTIEHGRIPLQPGMVISNEPGLYITDEATGIRIEDDLLITEDGCVNLTTTPKEIAEIEAIMKK